MSKTKTLAIYALNVFFISILWIAILWVAPSLMLTPVFPVIIGLVSLISGISTVLSYFIVWRLSRKEE